MQNNTPTGFGVQTPGNHMLTQQQTPNTSMTWGQSPFGPSQQTLPDGQFAPPAQHFGAHPSPVQPGQAPIHYLPGYLSKMRGTAERQPSGTMGRPLESTSPPSTREADTSLSLSAKDLQGAARLQPSSSPTHRFSSAFFNTSLGRSAEIDAAHMTPAAEGMREGSIFGAGGLRGSRRAMDDADRSMSVRPMTSPQVNGSAAFPPSDTFLNAMDDDDAPPPEALGDLTEQTIPSFATTLASASPNVTAQPSKSKSSAPTDDVPLAQRAVLVYGFPANLTSRIIDMFTTIGGLEKAEEVHLGGSSSREASDARKAGGTGTQPSIVRLTYRAPYLAMHAVRRSGEAIAHACMIGVRWEDPAVHELSLVKGLDAPLMFSGQGNAQTSTGLPGTPAVGRTMGAMGSAAQERASTPLIGRPIHVVDTPVAALAAHPSKNSAATTLESPLKAVAHASSSLWRNSVGTGNSTRNAEAQTGMPTQPPASLLGRLADGLFGW
ncbi:hypothetical protein MVES1_000893 [Malassezia vespertilionis]|uniref:RRM Nup35-type domain-containing protein n=1 Tax=Malassezia vespertilionis TaxID=2020962 RepID=A0A2N1JDV8_9BASI|nr:uncharacterized protein MVES1_000893 [Malassezia vespertilionis]PKI84730.1 hypothetical protein MVES_000841 [Malassezia vespertilionis]WFD05563.1 hypothetical protein MVES1_000893 [Malassezia vespertilionis]